MVPKSFYEKILQELHLRQTHEIGEFLQINKKVKKQKIDSKFLNSQIEQIQITITDTDVKHTYKDEFNFIIKNRCKIYGRGYLKKRELFKKWLDDQIIQTNNWIYIFWGLNKSCLYVGRTGNGGSRPASHFNKFWFTKAKFIDVYEIDNSNKLNKLECIAIHYFKPKYNRKKSARQERSHICPICDNQKYIAKQMKKIFCR